MYGISWQLQVLWGLEQTPGAASLPSGQLPPSYALPPVAPYIMILEGSSNNETPCLNTSSGSIVHLIHDRSTALKLSVAFWLGWKYKEGIS